MKKILILTVTAGNAHNACARGMKQRLEALGDCEVKIVDLLKTYSTKLAIWVTDGGYCLTVSKLPKIYDAFFKKYEKLDPSKRYRCPSQGTVLTVLNGLLKEILDFKPDVIYSTHFYGSIALTDLRLVYDLPCVCITSELDYMMSPFWESGIGVNYLAVPNGDGVEICLKKGYSREQILPVGIPVDGRTLEVCDKKEARKTLGLDEDTFTVMVMFGGGYWNGGFKIFKDLVKALKGRKAQIIMINGKNKKGYDKIEKMTFPKGITVKNVGFTDQIPLFMSASDVILNKCGGSSVTEIVNKGLPMLVTEKLVEQERNNLEYMKQKGVALSFKNARTLKENILKLMDDENLRREMSEKTLPLKKNAIGELAEFIISQPEADYSHLDGKEIDFSKVKSSVKKALKRADKEERRKK
ncbi:MAG: hypothetical protein K2N30_03475 [Clostridia bacterium]|nr:hypothetical protein [Clostridia bacterium]